MDIFIVHSKKNIRIQTMDTSVLMAQTIRNKRGTVMRQLGR